MKTNYTITDGNCPDGYELRPCGQLWGTFDYYKTCAPKDEKCPINDMKFVKKSEIPDGEIIYEGKISNSKKNYDWQYISFDSTYALAIQTMAFKYPLISIRALEKEPCLNLKEGQNSYQTANKNISNRTSKFTLEKSKAVEKCEETLNGVNEDTRYKEVEGAPSLSQEEFF